MYILHKLTGSNGVKNALAIFRYNAKHHRKRKKSPRNLSIPGPFFIAGKGFEPHDLRVMSPTSYQTALPRDIRFSTEDAGHRVRTGT